MEIEEYFHQVFTIDLGLHDGKRGDYLLCSSIYKKGRSLQIVPDTLQSYLQGDTPKDMALASDFIFYDLFHSNQRIMCNSPEIMYEQYMPFVKSRGRVLLGGLGLGVIPRLMCRKENVKSVTVIELSREVIDLCGFEHKKLEIIQSDFYAFIRKEDLSAYDYIFVDAYTSEGNVYGDIILPTRKYMLSHYPEVTIDFWHEEQFKFDYALTHLKGRDHFTAD